MVRQEVSAQANVESGVDELTKGYVILANTGDVVTVMNTYVWALRDKAEETAAELGLTEWAVVGIDFDGFALDHIGPFPYGDKDAYRKAKKDAS